MEVQSYLRKLGFQLNRLNECKIKHKIITSTYTCQMLGTAFGEYYWKKGNKNGREDKGDRDREACSH